MGLDDLTSNQDEEQNLPTSDEFWQEVERCSEVLSQTLDWHVAETDTSKHTRPVPHPL